MRKSAFLLVALAIPLGTWVAFAQQSTRPESIRVDVNLVNVAFSVRDAGGSLVDNLTADDFEVVEDAAPKKSPSSPKASMCR